MHDLDFITNNPEEFDAAMESRGVVACSFEIIDLDKKRKEKITQVQLLQSEKNKIVKSFSSISAAERDDLIKRSNEIEHQIRTFKAEAENVANELDQILLNIPNISDKTVPIGKDESSNLEILRVGTPRKFSFEPKPHEELGVALGMLDFEKTAKISGARFATLKDDLAKLYRVLLNFMVEHNKSFGHQEFFAPFLVKEEAMYGAGQLPKFSQDSFVVDGKFRLIPTSEVTLANFFADSCFSFEELPLRMTAYSECFRSEAGSSGKDTKGIIRQHQFGKVELFSATFKEDSDNELERMAGIVESLLQKLEIPYRKVLLCTGDMGFCAKKTYDIDVWIPSQDRYREISSCSNCGDFQARRMNAKYSKDGKRNFLHTLNGSSLAIGRTLVAIIENYQNADGTITFPDVLKAYF